MKKINKLLVASMACLATMLFVTACDNDDLDTNQYKGGVSLNVFGPSPVVRGGTLRFLGSNLDQVNQVLIPGVSAITDIEVTRSGVPSEIRVQVPVDGPEPGIITLVTASGQELQTASEVSYIETIELEGFSPATVMPGSVLTISGDYLNLIQEVIFTDNVIVKKADFLSQSRYQITVTVPNEAATGTIILSDGDSQDETTISNLIESENELVVGTPEVTSFTSASGRFKSGATLTIAGSYLHLVESILFEGATVYAPGVAEEGQPTFTINEEGTQITLAQPATAAAGEVSLGLVSGVEVPFATVEQFAVVTPSNLAISSAKVKAGQSMTITGADLDLVTSVSFAEAVDGGQFTATATSLEVSVVPYAAVDGELTLSMANGMTSTVAYTLAKPVVTAYSSNPVGAGAALTITGTDLDLVSTVSIGGDAVAPNEGGSATSISLMVPMNSVSGKPVFTLSNGTTTEAALDLTVNEAAFCYATELPNTSEAPVPPGSVLQLPVANGSQLTGVEINGVAAAYILNSDVLYISVPAENEGEFAFRLISSNGEITYTLLVAFEVPATVIWEGNVNIGNWGAFSDLSWDGYDWSFLQAGHTLAFHYTLDTASTYWQMRVAKGNGWAALTGSQNPYALTEGSTVLEVVLTDAMVNELVSDGGLIVTGCNYTLTKITYK